MASPEQLCCYGCLGKLSLVGILFENAVFYFLYLMDSIV